MNATLPVRIVGSAALAIAEAAEWWIANRPKAPHAFRDDIEAALNLIASHPGAGARSKSEKVKDLRRLHLVRVNYHLYYRVTTEPSIEVFGTRAVGPALKFSAFPTNSRDSLNLQRR